MTKLTIKQQFENIWAFRHYHDKRKGAIAELEKTESYKWFLDGYGCAVIGKLDERKEERKDIIKLIRKMRTGKVKNDLCKGWNNALIKLEDELEKKL
jgi:hypothetical protein